MKRMEQSHTLAVRRLVPRITRSVLAEKISAFWFSATCLYIGRRSCKEEQETQHKAYSASAIVPPCNVFRTDPKSISLILWTISF